MMTLDEFTRTDLSTDRLHDEIVIRPWAPGIAVEPICELINSVYLKAEEGIWSADKKRITEDAFESNQQNGQTLLAYIGEELAGTIYFVKEHSTLAKFEQLAVAPAFRNQGVGSELVSAVETLAQDQGCKHIKFELLVPIGRKHLEKEQLQHWYEKRGYEISGKDTIENFCPEALKYLVAPAEFRIGTKPLGSPP